MAFQLPSGKLLICLATFTWCTRRINKINGNYSLFFTIKKLIESIYINILALFISLLSVILEKNNNNKKYF